MAIHDEFADLAIELIRENGRSVTIRDKQITRAAQRWKIASTANVDQTESAVFFEDSTSDLQIALVQILGRPEGANTSAGKRNIEAWIPARDLTFAIDKSHTIIDGTRTWEIADVELLQPGTTAIMYVCTLRR